MESKYFNKLLLFNFGILLLGILTGMMVYNNVYLYSIGESKTIAIWLILAMPVLLGIACGITQETDPYMRAGLTLALYMVATAPLLGEGIICLVIYSPIALAATLLMCLITRYIMRKVSPRKKPLTAIVLILIPGLMAEADKHLAPRERETVTIEDSVEISLPPQKIWGMIARTNYSYKASEVPFLIRQLMPVPQSIEGLGADIGDRRIVKFHNGVVTANITHSEIPRYFEFNLEIKSHGPEFFDRWVNFDKSSFRFEQLGPELTRVTHTTSYLPRVYPRWYFEPVERLLAHQTQKYMLSHFFREQPVPALRPLAGR